jgi:hypothetical protein
MSYLVHHIFSDEEFFWEYSFSSFLYPVCGEIHDVRQELIYGKFMQNNVMGAACLPEIWSAECIPGQKPDDQILTIFSPTCGVAVYANVIRFNYIANGFVYGCTVSSEYV